jgi:FixJ family two-component response regulator
MTFVVCMSIPLPHGSPMAIYILEDDAAVSHALTFMLGHLGFAVIAFADAETFMRHPPPMRDDVVFVDLVLPGMGGADAIRWLQRLAEPPRIVAMSGYSQRIIDAALRGLCVAHVLRKPLSHAAVVAQLPPLAQGG